jgi:asparagine synthase (glutamine-hydrolysing)
MSENEFIKKLREATGKNMGDGLLLSGGVDSAAIAYLARVRSFTVSLEDHGKDREYAELVAKHLQIPLHCISMSVEEAIGAIPEVIRILKTFDPAIPNDLAVYFALTKAKEQGCKTVMTGDGGDELFAGYGYMLDLDLKEYIQSIAGNLHFSSSTLGEALDIEMKQPFLDKEFIEFALGIDPEEKVKERNGKRWGKWILRKSFEGLLPESIVWREKSPLEEGSGMSRIRNVLEQRISQAEFEEKEEEYGIRLRGREHLYYYEVYRRVVGRIPEPKKDEGACIYCGAGIPMHSEHCRICGGMQHNDSY